MRSLRTVAKWQGTDHTPFLGTLIDGQASGKSVTAGQIGKRPQTENEMSEGNMSKRATSGRTVTLEDAIARAGDELSATIGLPEHIEPGEIKFTFMVDAGDSPQAEDITFTWDGGLSATWLQDISEHESNLSPASSAPVWGWASWRNGGDLLLAYTWPDVEVDGWAHIPGGAPGSEDQEDTLSEPQTWVELARTIISVLRGEELPKRTGQTYE
ncbi:hypothetical protein CA951_02995 [Rhodococcus sp. NCIMB 12038]|nr:hypothetical protein CA951_02995 [Rhodococcus sp. NCIMB 12038]